jgi:hypothetical protein
MLLEFASMSNRDGDLVGRIEIKQGSAGSVPVDIKPSIGELLRPPMKTSVDEFDSTMNRMQGFQRVESSFTSSSTPDKILQSVVKNCALTLVGNKPTSSDSKLRFMALLPSSNDPVLVSVQTPQGGGGAGKIVVCCDHAVAINSILSLMKRAVAP